MACAGIVIVEVSNNLMVCSKAQFYFIDWLTKLDTINPQHMTPA